jgi:DNA-binding NarL/FixJ family response regulator
MTTILVIEDEPRTRANLETILEMEGYTVVTAENGRAGCQRARETRPDLILCDVTMPELDGYGVLEMLRADRVTAAIPFIFLTAKGDKSEVRAGMTLGADDYLTKPASASDLLASVAARLKRELLRPAAEFKPDFSSPTPLHALGLTPRESEVLLWVAQGKSNLEIATILGASENTVKKHLQNLFEKLGVDSRNAATLLALEHLGPR